MSDYRPFGYLLKHDLSARGERASSTWLGLHRWPGLLFSVLLWLALTTWQGPHVHFNMNYDWYAVFALPVIAMGTATDQVTREHKYRTEGWWLALPFPRWQLLLSKSIASVVLAVRSAAYLGLVAVLGIYIMALNRTISSAAVFHFLVTGLTWTAVMCCLIPPMVAVGVLFGVLAVSRPMIPNVVVWLLLAAAIWLLIAHYSVYLAVSAPMLVTVKWVFAFGLAGAWIFAALMLWMTTSLL